MQTKRLFLFIVISAVFLSKPVNAQGFKAGFTVTPLGANDILRTSLDGAAGYSGDGFYIVGITFQIPVNSRLEVETGLEFAKHTVKISPNLPPGMDNTPYKSDFKLATIPITLKMNFMQYLYVNGGVLFDLDTSKSRPIDNQTGLGAILGVGVNYDFKFGGTIFANPYMKCHSLVPFSPERYHQRLFDSGIRFGFMYKFSTK